jgi:hypothetical protein
MVIMKNTDIKILMDKWVLGLLNLEKWDGVLCLPTHLLPELFSWMILMVFVFLIYILWRI